MIFIENHKKIDFDFKSFYKNDFDFKTICCKWFDFDLKLILWWFFPNTCPNISYNYNHLNNSKINNYNKKNYKDSNN